MSLVVGRSRCSGGALFHSGSEDDSRRRPPRVSPIAGVQAPFAGKCGEDRLCDFHTADLVVFARQMQEHSLIFAMVSAAESAQTTPVLSSGDLLNRLSERGISRADIARALGIDASAVTRMFKKERRIYLDEAKTLVEHFDLENTAAPILSEPLARMLVLHAAQGLGVELPADDPRVKELASDYRAFSAFLADPRARESVDQVEGFFRALALRRSHAS